MGSEMCIRDSYRTMRRRGAARGADDAGASTPQPPAEADPEPKRARVEAPLRSAGPEPGDEYEGERDQEGRYHGDGTLRRGNWRYKGQFLQGLHHGMGHLECSDPKLQYTGQWQHGRRHGKGRHVESSGVSYVGEWADNRRHGHGVTREPDGMTTHGRFVEGKQVSMVVKMPDGGTLMHSVSEDGTRVGILVFADGCEQKGTWRTDAADKHVFYGLATSPDGVIFRGKSVNGEKEGPALRTLPNGRLEEATYANGELHGLARQVHDRELNAKAMPYSLFERGQHVAGPVLGQSDGTQEVLQQLQSLLSLSRPVG